MDLKACWLKNKMLLSPIFGFDTLNFTKGKFTGHELWRYEFRILRGEGQSEIKCFGK